MPSSVNHYLCRHFGREIAAHDIQTKRCDVYGSGEGYQERVMLIYDGLHYDALALAGASLCDFCVDPLSRPLPPPPHTHPPNRPSLICCELHHRCSGACRCAPLLVACLLYTSTHQYSILSYKLSSTSVQVKFCLFWGSHVLHTGRSHRAQR